jgi:hypothetical protein
VHDGVPTVASSGVIVLPCQLAMLKFMPHRGHFVATVGIPLAKCNNGKNNNNMMETVTLHSS